MPLSAFCGICTKHCEARQCAAPALLGGQHGIGALWQCMAVIAVASVTVTIVVHTAATAKTRLRNVRGRRDTIMPASLAAAVAARSDRRHCPWGSKNIFWANC